MNMTDLIQSYFDGDNAARLGQAAGIDAKQAQNALATGLPLQLRALAEHAAHPEGQKQVLEAVSSLPNFGTIAEVLGSSDGASNLQRAGELLSPALLGGKAESILSSVTGQVGASSNGNGIQKILHMALPLVLSLLGRQGLNAGNIASVLSGLSGEGAGVANAALGAVPAMAAGLGAAGLATAAAKAGADNGLLELLKAQFSGANADKIGAAAGFTGNAAGRAVQGTLPVVLNALVNKGKTEAGASDLLKMAAPFAGLSNSDGHLNTQLLSDSAELARVEGQGRGLLGGLFGNVDEIAGRLGTGLGGSGSNASRLLALVAPLVLSLLGKRAGSASVLSSLLGGVSASHLSGLLPAGLTGLGALLGAGSAAAATVRTPVTTPATETVVAKAEPAKVVTQTPRPVTPPPTVTTTEKRGGIPWWLWLIPLILLALLFTLCNKKPAPVAAAPGCALIVENPASDSKLPIEGFTMSGKAPANSTVKIMDQGQAVATATADANCAWTAPVPAPTAGEHTFSVEDGDAKSEFKANFAADAAAITPAASGAAASGAAASGAAATTPAGDGTFAITNPAAAATLPAGGFDLKGTGKAGDEVEVFQDGTSLGKTTIASDGTWVKSVPSPAAGAHTYSVKGPDGTELGNVATTVGAADANASATNCTKDYALKSITDGQQVSEPFLFGGEGKGKGYSITVKRGARTVGTKDIALDSSCGWSYNSKPGKGQISYEVRPMGEASAPALSTINLTVTN